MAKVIRRTWTSDGPLGKRVRHTAFGYTLTVNGKRERKFSSAWLKEADALKALSERQEQIRGGRIERPEEATLGEVADRYLKYKEDHRKRSLKDDVRIFRHRLLPSFGATLPIRHLTEARIAQVDRRGLASRSRRSRR